jgi:hypothetical protein
MMNADWVKELRERLFGAEVRSDAVGSGMLALIRPVPPFDGRGSALVAFGSLLLLIGSVTFGLLSLAGLLAALAAIYLILARVFGIRLDLPEVPNFGP